MSKRFDQELYNKDDAAKFFVIDFFTERYGFNVYVNPDEYGIDLIVENDRGTFGLEVEVKHNWRTVKFPFDSIHFAYRKIKFAKDPANVHFIMLSHNWTWALLVDGETFASSPIVIKDTIYSRNEKFIEVPSSKCRILRLY